MLLPHKKMMLFFTVLFASSTSVWGLPPIKLYSNYNNVYGSLQDPGQGIGSVRFLGILNSTDDCMKACVTLGQHRCSSFTYHKSDFPGEFQKHCYGIVDDPIWSPMQEDHVDCGRVLWPCRNDSDCSLNGKCMKNGRCQCRPQWTGPRCGELVLKPANRQSGYHYQENGVNVSSWGGAVLHDEKDKTYHMYLAEMTKHCGINSWTVNSQVVHSASDSPVGTFKRVEVLREPFAHEPDAIRGPKGEYVLFWSEYHYKNWSLCNCTDGSTSPDCHFPNPAMYNEYMSYSNTPNGPWSKPVAILGLGRIIDTNFAAVLLNDSRLIGFARAIVDSPNPFTVSRMHLVLASDWKDPTTYKESPDDLFPHLPADGVEDPFLYRDQNGYFHAIFHNMYPADTQESCGGHAYSVDGIYWTFGGRSFGNRVEFTDGSSFTFTRRERPHFVFADDGVTPVALTNGAQYGGKYGDATYTLLQPIGP